MWFERPTGGACVRPAGGRHAEYFYLFILLLERRACGLKGLEAVSGRRVFFVGFFLGGDVIVLFYCWSVFERWGIDDWLLSDAWEYRYAIIIALRVFVTVAFSETIIISVPFAE